MRLSTHASGLHERPLSVRAKLMAAATAVLLLCTFAAYAQNPLLTEARTLQAQGRPLEALKLLDPLETRLASDREYNYLLAQTLLDAGQAARALFPINRLLRQDPKDSAALLLLSRARIALGQAQPAREALERARKGEPRPEVEQRIAQYLSIIESAEETGRTRIGGHLEVSYGYDTNVNTATGAQQIALPVFGGAIGTLNAAATKQSDSFFSLGGTIGLKHPLTTDLAVVAAASVSQRMNHSKDQFDLRTIDGSIGLRYVTGADEWTGVVTAQQFDVDYQRFRVTTGGSVQWRRVLGAGTEATAFAQLARLDYPSQSVRNTDRTVLGFAVAHALPGPRQPIVFASFYGGREDERASGVPFFGHQLVGGRVGVDKSFSDRFGISISASYEHRRYGGQDPLFLEQRVDEQWDLRVAMPFAFAQHWLLIPQLSHTRNGSTVELNAYRRTAVFVSLRYVY